MRTLLLCTVVPDSALSPLHTLSFILHNNLLDNCEDSHSTGEATEENEISISDQITKSDFRAWTFHCST